MPDKKNPSVLRPDSRIGILNRGESACRFIRSVREYNTIHGSRLKSIAFYIEKEEESLFVRQSDESFLLSDEKKKSGKGDAGFYLDHSLLISALKKADCQAVWVGWGFISEDSEFAEKVEKEGFVFLGPSSRAMKLLGDKITAKELAEKNDVPVLPWSGNPLSSLKDAGRKAEEIGYPVIIKASNAGGGRGIRVVKSPDELQKQYNSAREETIRITGNDVLFMECFVSRGRHFEVQVLADFHNNINTFGVRDCSVQRRNQKIIEETPPAALDESVIKSMEEASLRLIRAAEYRGAGTVEYLYDIDRKQFYFMEVNTRLQVEHPITEILYGIDLVKGQIDVAMGKAVDLGGKKPSGSVIEVRLNAEDPGSNFNPSPGLVLLFNPPAGPGIRVDSGIEQYSDIPSDFDSMVAKVISYGSDRGEALARMKRGLQELKIKIRDGTTNKSFVLDLLDEPDIIKGGIHTGFVEELLEKKAFTSTGYQTEAALLSSAVELYRKQQEDSLINFRNQISKTGSPRITPSTEGEKISLSCRGSSYLFLVKYTGDSYYHISCNGKDLVCRYKVRGQESSIEFGGVKYSLIITHRGDSLLCDIDGAVVPVESQSGGYVKSLSPAIVLSVSAETDAHVKKGDPLLVLEAMKMEMVISAPKSGKIKEIFVAEGEQVSAGQSLLRIDDSMPDQEDAGTSESGPVDFTSMVSDGVDRWEWLKREVSAVFLGFDNERPGIEVFREFLDFALSSPEFHKELVKVLIGIVGKYVYIEKLFIAEELKSDLFSRPLSYREMLSHFFRRTSERGKGLPEKFLEDLYNAADCFPSAGEGDPADSDTLNYALLNIFKSHKNRKIKEEILMLLFSRLKELEIPEEMFAVLSALTDEVIRLSLSPFLSDAAVSARYSIMDSTKLKSIRGDSCRNLESVITGILNSEVVSENDLGSLIDSAPYIMSDFIDLALSPDMVKKELGLRLTGLRFSRDREVVNSGYLFGEGPDLFFVESRMNSEQYKSFYAVMDKSDIPESFDTGKWFSGCSEKIKREIILIIRNKTASDSEELIENIRNRVLPEKCLMSLGVYNTKGEACFRSYTPESGGWGEELQMKGFSPLQYRELKVYRFRDFYLDIRYQREAVIVAEARSRINENDIRLIAFVDLSEMLSDISESSIPFRLVMFESHYTDAVNAMRALQAQYKSRLLWNRIIVHNRTLLGIRIKDLQDYACKLMQLTGDIGLEKFTVLTRRKRWSESFARSVELNFIPVTDGQVIIRNRIPSEGFLKPLDSYSAKVINARQKKTVYPYEIIKMLTGSGFPGKEEFQYGKFEEYDIEFESGTMGQTIISAAGRPPGLNPSNIVFGIIENSFRDMEFPMRRVLVLSDATRDMGSLAEEESRRIIAALDLAENENIPFEWVPVSSGARIDMESGTENLDWTASVLRRIIEFTQRGGEINIIVSSINVGAQSYWNAEATMLMHTKGLLIMTDGASMLLTGKKALDFSGSISGENNLEIGGAEKIMAPNGQAQIRVSNLSDAYKALFSHYRYTYLPPDEGTRLPSKTSDRDDRDISNEPYNDFLQQGFSTIGDIFSVEKNPERKKPFDIQQVMKAVIDRDGGYLERWKNMHDSDTSVVWETRVGGISVGMIGIESRTLSRIGEIPHDGPENWSGGTLYPMSSKKIARALNAFSKVMPVVILANLSGFDGSPESLRKLQLEYGAEIGRAVVNFQGPIIFIVIARYHGGAYVVFSRALNPSLTVAALEGSYASVIGGAPAAAVVFPRKVLKAAYSDENVKVLMKKLEKNICSRGEFDECFKKVYNEKQKELGNSFDRIHSVERAKKVGSIDDIISPEKLRPYIIGRLREKNMAAREQWKS